MFPCIRIHILLHLFNGLRLLRFCSSLWIVILPCCLGFGLLYDLVCYILGLLYADSAIFNDLYMDYILCDVLLWLSCYFRFIFRVCLFSVNWNTQQDGYVMVVFKSDSLELHL